MIVTLAEVKEYLKIDQLDTTYDDFLTRQIQAAQNWVEEYCGQRFELVNIVNEVVNGTGKLYLPLKNIPIVSVQSVQYSDDFGQTWKNFEGRVITDGYLIYSDKTFCLGVANFKVSYSAGWTVPPPAVKKVVVEKVAEIFSQGPGQGRLGIDAVSSSIGGGSINTRYIDLFEKHKKELEPFKIIRIL